MFYILECQECALKRVEEADADSDSSEMILFEMRQQVSDHIRKTGHTKISIKKLGSNKVPQKERIRRAEEERKQRVRERKERKQKSKEMEKQWAREQYQELKKSGNERIQAALRMKRFDLLPAVTRKNLEPIIEELKAKKGVVPGNPKGYGVER
ncbi:hypothetical protein AKJ58_01675 [candidate division MSBL1 archaeon SCGC-AAA385D11]|uniref:Uncharacterized protein n=1 Tax=candidate division MSBL1 archaeon SCGC-AAA385D11 TaxID=1698286 RepID=A0A133VN44_9EURY|nr:hypothetical protein AKJ58_01675 [candidate division MSBL1 archaeon SCGC-AAA385D11]